MSRAPAAVSADDIEEVRLYLDDENCKRTKYDNMKRGAHKAACVLLTALDAATARAEEAEGKIEAAHMAVAETQPDWGWRLYRVFAALGLDFGKAEEINRQINARATAATAEAARLRKAAGDALAWLDALTNPSTHIVALAEGLRAALAPTPAPEGPSEDASSEAYAALRALRDYFAARDGDEAMAAYDAAAVALTNLAGRGRA